MPSDKPRFTILVDEDLLKTIDDFRFENRFNSRSAAAEALIKMALAQQDNKDPSKPSEEEPTEKT